MADPVRVLVIDDEPQIRRFLRVSLSAEGMSVSEAQNGAEGLLHIQSTQPDLVILDLGLPDADGLPLIPKTRKPSAVPIAVFSARNDDQGRVRARDAGAKDSLVNHSAPPNCSRGCAPHC